MSVEIWQRLGRLDGRRSGLRLPEHRFWSFAGHDGGKAVPVHLLDLGQCCLSSLPQSGGLGMEDYLLLGLLVGLHLFVDVRFERVAIPALSKILFQIFYQRVSVASGRTEDDRGAS